MVSARASEAITSSRLKETSLVPLVRDLWCTALVCRSGEPSWCTGSCTKTYFYYKLPYLKSYKFRQAFRPVDNPWLSMGMVGSMI